MTNPNTVPKIGQHTLDEITGTAYFPTDNGDPTGVSYGPDDDEPIAKVDATIPPPMTGLPPKTNDASTAPSWWDIAKNVLFDATNPKVVETFLPDRTVTPPPPPPKNNNVIWIIVGVVVVVIILLYFAFKKDK